MTMPHLMNCGHSEEGWCLDCVKDMGDKLTEVDLIVHEFVNKQVQVHERCWYYPELFNRLAKILDIEQVNSSNLPTRE